MSFIEKSKIAGVAGLMVGAFALAAGDAAAADFYKGKQITVYSSGSGTYMAYARFLGKFMTKYIPGNPSWVVKEMRGASGLTATNYMFKKGKKDGTEIAAVHGHIPTTPIFESRGVEYDPNKLNWIGSATKEIFISYVWHEAKAHTLDEMKTTKTTFGGQAVGSFSIDLAILAKRMIGLNLDILTGYSGSAETRLAMERREIDGNFGSAWSAVMRGEPTWIKEKKIYIVAQTGEKRSAKMPDVPLILDYVKGENRKAMQLYLSRTETGKPYFTSPGVPKERVAILRAAFDKSVRDPEFLEMARKGNLDVDDPMTGQEIEQFIKELSGTSKATVKMLDDAWASFGDQKK